jgi:DNA-binding FrmR family transcriptional regulator
MENGGSEMNQNMDVENVIRRLRRIEGQVRGVAKMVEEDKPCEDILIQIGSVKAALHKVGQFVLEGHLHHCVLDGIQAGSGDEVLAKLSGALEQFSRLV